LSAALGTWVDGVRTDSLPADDRGFQYGDGLFETLIARAGSVRFLEAHLARLKSGCERLGITFNAMQSLRADIATALSLGPPQVALKIIVTRGSAIRRGYAPHGNEAARRVLSSWPSPAGSDAHVDGVDLCLSSHRLAANPALAGIKHLSRIGNVMASAEASKAKCFDALLLDAAGRVISGAMSNVFTVREGRVVTPRVDQCGVAGVMRAVVLRECAALGIGIAEENLTLEEMFAADEAFVTNVRIGVVPVRRVGEHSFGMNILSRRLRTHIETLDA
jgi:4-amino-4-deoxychorismate lyase